MVHLLSVATVLLVALAPLPAIGAEVRDEISRKAAHADEEYYLSIALAHHLLEWVEALQQLPDKQAYHQLADQVRDRLIKLQTRCEVAGLSDDLAKSFGAYAGVIEHVRRGMTIIESIRNESNKETQKQSFKSGVKGGSAAASTYVALQGTDASSKEAIAYSLIAGAFTFAVDSWGKFDGISDSRKDRVADVKRRITDAITKADVNVKQRMLRLAKAKKWKPSESVWSISEAESEATLKIMTGSDLQAIRREYQRQVAIRPRDPFVRIEHVGLQAEQHQSDYKRLMQLAEEAFVIRQLVPNNPLYSDHKMLCQVQAGLIASMARSAELKRHPTRRISKIGGRAVDIWTEIARNVPEEPFAPAKLAGALLQNGAPAKARKEAEKAVEEMKQDPEFLATFALILAQLSAWDETLVTLEAGLRVGAFLPKRLETIPEFKPLLRVRKDQFNALITPRWSWAATQDEIIDDITFRNDSTFPLSGIEFTVVMKKGSTVKRRVLKSDEVLFPGKTKTWKDAVLGVSGNWDRSSSASLSCDQTKIPGVWPGPVTARP